MTSLSFITIVYLCNYNNIPFMVQLMTKYFKVCLVLIGNTVNIVAIYPDERNSDQALWRRDKCCVRVCTFLFG
jgi:hypothetical protein